MADVFNEAGILACDTWVGNASQFWTYAYDIKSVNVNPYFPNAGTYENPGVYFGEISWTAHGQRFTEYGLFISHTGNDADQHKYIVTVVYEDKLSYN